MWAFTKSFTTSALGLLGNSFESEPASGHVGACRTMNLRKKAQQESKAADMAANLRNQDLGTGSIGGWDDGDDDDIDLGDNDDDDDDEGSAQTFQLRKSNDSVCVR